MSGQIQRFLAPDDFYQLTSYRHPSLQCKALKDSGVFFIPRKDGRPGTTWDHVSNPTGFKLIASNTEEEEPNFKDMQYLELAKTPMVTGCLPAFTGENLHMNFAQ